MMSPAMISRMALVRAMPGTSTIRVPMVTVSRLLPSPICTSARDSREASALQKAVRKKLLEPMKRLPYSRQIPTARPPVIAASASVTPPPNRGEKKAGAIP